MNNVEVITVPGVSSYSGTLYNVPVGTHSFSVQTVYTGSCYPPPGAYNCLNNTHHRSIVVEQSGTPQAPPIVRWQNMSITNGHIYMQWSPGSGSIAQYEIYRATFNPNAPYTLIAIIPINQTSYTDNSFNAIATNANLPYKIYAYSIHSRGTNGLLSGYQCNPYNPSCWYTSFPNCMVNPIQTEE